MFYAPALRSRHLAPAFRSYDRSFERFINDHFFAPASSGLNAKQDDKGWTVTLDLPGVAREDLTVSLEGSVARLETRAEAKRQFKAAWDFGDEIDAEASTATLENGVLTLVLAKKAPVSNARTLEIK